MHRRPPRRPGIIPPSLREIAAVTGGTVEGDGAVTVTAPGGLFVAFAGEHADGHHYARQGRPARRHD